MFTSSCFIASLVLDYLQECGCKESYQKFLKECPDLAEKRAVLARGIVGASHVGSSLLDIVDDYCETQEIVRLAFKELPAQLFAGVRRNDSVSTIVKHLVKLVPKRSSVVEKVDGGYRYSTGLPKRANVPFRYEAETVSDAWRSTNGIPLAITATEERSRAKSGCGEEIDLPAFVDSLMNNFEFHETLADKINRVRRVDGSDDVKNQSNFSDIASQILPSLSVGEPSVPKRPGSPTKLGDVLHKKNHSRKGGKKCDAPPTCTPNEVLITFIQIPPAPSGPLEKPRDSGLNTPEFDAPKDDRTPNGFDQLMSAPILSNAQQKKELNSSSLRGNVGSDQRCSIEQGLSSITVPDIPIGMSNHVPRLFETPANQEPKQNTTNLGTLSGASGTSDMRTPAGNHFEFPALQQASSGQVRLGNGPVSTEGLGSNNQNANVLGPRTTQNQTSSVTQTNHGILRPTRYLEYPQTNHAEKQVTKFEVPARPDGRNVRNILDLDTGALTTEVDKDLAQAQAALPDFNLDTQDSLFASFRKDVFTEPEMSLSAMFEPETKDGSGGSAKRKSFGKDSIGSEFWDSINVTMNEVNKQLEGASSDTVVGTQEPTPLAGFVPFQPSLPTTEAGSVFLPAVPGAPGSVGSPLLSAQHEITAVSPQGVVPVVKPVFADSAQKRRTPRRVKPTFVRKPSSSHIRTLDFGASPMKKTGKTPKKALSKIVPDSFGLPPSVVPQALSGITEVSHVTDQKGCLTDVGGKTSRHEETFSRVDNPGQWVPGEPQQGQVVEGAAQSIAVVAFKSSAKLANGLVAPGPSLSPGIIESRGNLTRISEPSEPGQVAPGACGSTASGAGQGSTSGASSREETLNGVPLTEINATHQNGGFTGPIGSSRGAEAPISSLGDGVKKMSWDEKLRASLAESDKGVVPHYKGMKAVRYTPNKQQKGAKEKKETKTKAKSKQKETKAVAKPKAPRKPRKFKTFENKFVHYESEVSSSDGEAGDFNPTITDSTQKSGQLIEELLETPAKADPTPLPAPQPAKTGAKKRVVKQPKKNPAARERGVKKREVKGKIPEASDSENVVISRKTNGMTPKKAVLGLDTEASAPPTVVTAVPGGKPVQGTPSTPTPSDYTRNGASPHTSFESAVPNCELLQEPPFTPSEYIRKALGPPAHTDSAAPVGEPVPETPFTPSEFFRKALGTNYSESEAQVPINAGPPLDKFVAPSSLSGTSAGAQSETITLYTQTSQPKAMIRFVSTESFDIFDYKTPVKNFSDSIPPTPGRNLEHSSSFSPFSLTTGFGTLPVLESPFFDGPPPTPQLLATPDSKGSWSSNVLNTPRVAELQTMLMHNISPTQVVIGGYFTPSGERGPIRLEDEVTPQRCDESLDTAENALINIGNSLEQEMAARSKKDLMQELENASKDIPVAPRKIGPEPKMHEQCPKKQRKAPQVKKNAKTRERPKSADAPKTRPASAKPSKKKQSASKGRQTIPDSPTSPEPPLGLTLKPKNEASNCKRGNMGSLTSATLSKKVQKSSEAAAQLLRSAMTPSRCHEETLMAVDVPFKDFSLQIDSPLVFHDEQSLGSQKSPHPSSFLTHSTEISSESSQYPSPPKPSPPRQTRATRSRPAKEFFELDMDAPPNVVVTKVMRRDKVGRDLDLCEANLKAGYEGEVDPDVEADVVLSTSCSRRCSASANNSLSGFRSGRSSANDSKARALSANGSLPGGEHVRSSLEKRRSSVSDSRTRAVSANGSLSAVDHEVLSTSQRRTSSEDRRSPASKMLSQELIAKKGLPELSSNERRVSFEAEKLDGVASPPRRRNNSYLVSSSDEEADAASLPVDSKKKKPPNKKAPKKKRSQTPTVAEVTNPSTELVTACVENVEQPALLEQPVALSSLKPPGQQLEVQSQGMVVTSQEPEAREDQQLSAKKKEKPPAMSQPVHVVESKIPTPLPNQADSVLSKTVYVPSPRKRDGVTALSASHAWNLYESAPTTTEVGHLTHSVDLQEASIVTKAQTGASTHPADPFEVEMKILPLNPLPEARLEDPRIRHPPCEVNLTPLRYERDSNTPATFVCLRIPTPKKHLYGRTRYVETPAPRMDKAPSTRSVNDDSPPLETFLPQRPSVLTPRAQQPDLELSGNESELDVSDALVIECNGLTNTSVNQTTIVGETAHDFEQSMTLSPVLLSEGPNASKKCDRGFKGAVKDFERRRESVAFMASTPARSGICRSQPSKGLKAKNSTLNKCEPSGKAREMCGDIESLVKSRKEAEPVSSKGDAGQSRDAVKQCVDGRYHSETLKKPGHDRSIEYPGRSNSLKDADHANPRLLESTRRHADQPKASVTTSLDETHLSDYKRNQVDQLKSSKKRPQANLSQSEISVRNTDWPESSGNAIQDLKAEGSRKRKRDDEKASDQSKGPKMPRQDRFDESELSVKLADESETFKKPLLIGDSRSVFMRRTDYTTVKSEKRTSIEGVKGATMVPVSFQPLGSRAPPVNLPSYEEIPSEPANCQQLRKPTRVSNRVDPVRERIPSPEELVLPSPLKKLINRLSSSNVNVEMMSPRKVAEGLKSLQPPLPPSPKRTPLKCSSNPRGQRNSKKRSMLKVDPRLPEPVVTVHVTKPTMDIQRELKYTSASLPVVKRHVMSGLSIVSGDLFDSESASASRVEQRGISDFEFGSASENSLDSLDLALR